MAGIDTAPAHPSALSPMRYPVFRAVWLASTLSNLGSLVQSVGASWMMISLAGSAGMVALVQTSVALPVMMLSLAAGAIADNRDRRVVMLASQLFMLAVSLALAACAWAGWVTPWLLLAFTFLIGCGSAFYAPAWQASVGEMVPRAELPGAVALNSMGFNIARSVGPAVGGVIVAAAGVAAAFAANAASYVALIGVLARWRPPEVPRLLPRESLGVAMAAGVRYVAMSPAIRSVLLRSVVFGMGASAVVALMPRLLPRESLGVAMAAGVRYVAMSPAIRSVLLRSVVFGAGASAVVALMPLVARHLLGGGPLTYGLLLGAFGAGAVTGALCAARLRHSLSTEAVVRLACLAFAAAAALAGASEQPAATTIAVFVCGAGWVLALATFNVAVQLATPRWVVARALALYQMAAFGGIAGGSWLWGAVAERGGLDLAMFSAAGVLLACAAIGLWRPLAQSTDLDLDPWRPWEAPATAVPVDSRTGPVIVTIEYRIAEGDHLRFLAAMSERRRIRRRDGALNWRLMRDLSDPELWIERYETPTWLDYLRLNNRMTRSDAVVPESLRALHRGPEGPRVRRMIERPTGSLSAAQLEALQERPDLP